MRIERDGRKEQYTYADLRELATRAAGFLASEGIKQGDRVMLVSSNAPEWGMTYFGVLKAGATCIPCDPESSTAEILNFARAGNAAGIISEAVDDHPDLQERPATGLTRLWTYDEVFALPDEKLKTTHRAAAATRACTKRRITNLYFRHDGSTKGVMLSHRNLTSMVSMLSSVFDMTLTTACCQCCRCTTRLSSRPFLTPPVAARRSLTCPNSRAMRSRARSRTVT